MTTKPTKKPPAFVAQLSEVSRARLRGVKRKRQPMTREERDDAARVLEEVRTSWTKAIDRKP